MNRTPSRRKTAAPLAASPASDLPTYQDMLDAALEQTFPASDPISFSAAMYKASRVSSARNSIDWSLQPPTGRA